MIPPTAAIIFEVTLEDGKVILSHAPGLDDLDFLDSNVTYKKIPWLVAGPFPAETQVKL